MNFKNEKEKVLGQCQEISGVAKMPMIRVFVSTPNTRTDGEVYIFYRTKRHELFWFDL